MRRLSRRPLAGKIFSALSWERLCGEIPREAHVTCGEQKAFSPE